MDLLKRLKNKYSSDNTNLTILAEQTELIYTSVNNAILATLVNSLILVTVLWPVINHVLLIIWLIALYIVSIARGLIAFYYKNTEITFVNTLQWSRYFFFGTLLAALLWSASAIWLFPDADLARQVFLAFVIGGMAAAAVTNLSHIKLVIYPYLIVTLTPITIQFFISKSDLGYEMGIMLSLYMIMLLLSAKRNHANIQQNIHLHQESVLREQSLQESEQRYKTLLESATDAFILHDEDGNIVDVNHQTCRSLGYSREELLELKVSDIEVGQDSDRIGKLWTNLEQGENIQVEARHRRKDGTTFPVEVSLGMILMDDKNYYSVLIRDVTERKETQSYINDSQQRMAFHVQNTPLGVIEWDKNFCVLKWNPAAEVIFGFTKEEAIGRHAKELILPQSALKHVEMHWQQLLGLEGGLRSTNENITKQGNTILCEWYNTPLLNEAGEVFAVASFVQDVTQQKNIELELLKAKEEAEQANLSKSKFLSNMSHEIRTPMNAILGFSQILSLDESLSEDQRECAHDIITGGNHLLYLIDEILDLSSIESGKTDFNMENCSLNRILDESMSLIKPLATENGITLINNISSTTNYCIYVDDNRFKQILINLLSNAVKYNSKNGTVILSCEEVDGQNLKFNVKDQGEGLTSEDQKKLFKSFERLGKYKGIDGVGIGLVITKNLVERMGGKIGIESVVGQGSCFWIQFPSCNEANLQVKNRS